MLVLIDDGLRGLMAMGVAAVAVDQRPEEQ
jgi:hypothetical protein